uniref:Cyclic nucleotide-binding domain-containing protein n=1 Tax=Drosophila melanogaster TaxID=7227 RepID=Q9VXK3_DROME|nr:uncharacterized protein Dmel_CG12698 [Drosophila melanogaster]AAF48559.2 uncharacterized protein Dmel_CG12698 [Drosophila melanogaster]|eukprot:NP_573100.1 uncharacterized protein Dmel_CG12698 [Drosophila melanogaster]
MSKRQRDVHDGAGKKIAKIRFKKLIRSVILNMQWLSELPEEGGISLNVKKNVAMLRQKRKVGMMTMAEKSLLRTPHAKRSVDERKKLCTIVANLACFSKFPPKVRARLVPIVKFMAISPGRIVMKEEDFPVTIYFIIAGEVEMSKNIYKKGSSRPTVQTEAIFGPGDCIGDIDVMEDTPRTNTYIATTYCELLAIFNTNYKIVLLPFMQKMWQEKKDALRALDYFDFLNEEQIVNASKYGTIQQFEPLETIYTEDLGTMSYVYFVLSGECVVLQCLHMKVNMVNREKVFQLPNIYNLKTGPLLDDDTGPNDNEPLFDINEYVQSTSSLDENEQSKKRKLRKMGLQEIQRLCDEIKKPVSRRSTKESARQRLRLRQRGRDAERQITRKHYEFYLMGMGGESGNISEDLSEELYSDTSDMPTISTVASAEFESESEGSEIFTASSTSEQGNVEETVSQEGFETHFIDVGSLTFGGIFGLGEKMEHRVIMARTTVQCIVIPRFWLFEPAQNPGNFWQRQRFYIECNIPTREDLFKDFIKTRKWERFRRDYISSILNNESLANFTKHEDIPIISHIVETKSDDN